MVGSFIRVGPHVLTYMPDGFVQLATLTALVPPLTDMDLHVFLQQVTSQKLFMAQCALKGLVTCINKQKFANIQIYFLKGANVGLISCLDNF